jgi:hypothetical protein
VSDERLAAAGSVRAARRSVLPKPAVRRSQKRPHPTYLLLSGFMTASEREGGRYFQGGGDENRFGK